jgi:4-hydroxy-3-polyprenylbenzoate decarboxylase
VLETVINGTQEIFDSLKQFNVNIHYLGGETADVGDVVRTIAVNGTMTARWPKSKMVTNEKIQAGDVIVGFSSFGQTVYETEYKPKDVRALASVNHPAADIGASISSGSFQTMGMIILPCSIKTMSEIATGVTSSLVSRAADVVLKEKRRLVLAVRETPLHVGHLRTLTTLAEIGAVVAPIVPAFYNKPKTVDDIINHTVGRLLDLLGIETKLVKRWEGGPAED